jgi:hypothetical protein
MSRTCDSGRSARRHGAARWRASSGVVALALTLGLARCAPRLPLPAETSHEGDAPIAVPYPPPPAQVEMVGPPPDETAVWVDGSWRWTGASWAWTEGGWQHPPAAARYAPPITVRQSNGELVYFPGSWHAPSAPASPSAATTAR